MIQSEPRVIHDADVGQLIPFPDFVIRADELHTILHDPSVKIVDLRPAAHGGEGYLPGSVHLEYDRLIRRCGPVEGLMPEPGEISDLLSSLGIEPWHRVVAYDDETGVEAARFLWTLAVVGHEHFALLDGGFTAWNAGGFPTENSLDESCYSKYPVRPYQDAYADKLHVLNALGRLDVSIVDTRSDAEFRGEDARAERGGRIPGAVHFNWMSSIDLMGSGELLPKETLMERLSSLGVFPEQEVITYCQSNRRCAHTFVVLKWLGFDRVRSYAGSWSEWGNSTDTPIEN